MTKALQGICVNLLTGKNFSCTANNGVFDLEKLRSLADGVKPFFGPRLENRIHSGLEEFVCKPSSRYSRRFPRVKRCLDAVAAWLNYLDAFRAKDIEQETIKHAIECLLKDDRVTHFEEPLVLNTRANRVEPDSLTEQNAMKSMNVWSFIKEKDYWLCKDQAQATTSRTCESPLRIHPQPQERRKESYSSDLDVEIGSSTIELPTTERFSANKPCSNQKADNLRSLKSQARHDRKITSCSKQKEISTAVHEFRLLPTRRNLSDLQESTKIQSDRDQCCDQSVCPKRPKLKVVVHKTTSTKCPALWDPPKVTNLSIPCKSSHLIVRLFDADPSLSDSCLILMRRKFEHDIRNACSCMNDIFKKLDRSTIKRLCLNCQIRPGRIDLNLQRDDTAPKARMFLARVPICLNVHKRESSWRNLESSRDPTENPDVLDQCCANREEFQERQIAFYSQCSNHGLTEEKRTSSKTNTRKEWGKEVNFVWSRKERREVDFVLSPCFTESRAKERNLEENRVEIASKIHGENKGLVDDEKNDTCANASIMEDDPGKLDHTSCSCSSNNLGVGHVSRQDPEQCLCHVVFANNDSSELDDIEEKNQNFAIEKATSRDERDSQCQNDIKQENDGPEICAVAEDSVLESKSGIARVQDVSKLERSIVTVRSNSVSKVEIDKNISEIDEHCRAKESYSVDSISSSISKITRTSCDSKCSRCGKDLSDEEIRSVTNRVQPDISNIETHGTLNTASTKKIPSITLTLQPPKNKTFVMTIETSSRNCNDGDRDQETGLTNEDLELCKCSNDLNSRSGNGTNRKQFSRGSSSSTETESISERNCNARNPETNVEAGWKFSRQPGCCSSSCKTRCKSKDDTGFRFLSRRKDSLWRGSIVPGNLCSSFPALDRIKYLIRKKLRRLLLEERDRGTSTSKTCLRNDRYLVSISSGKLNEGRICSSIRCPFTARNLLEVRYPQKTFAEGSSLAKKENKKDTFEECVRGRCRRMIRDNEVFRKVRLAEISRFLGQKGGSKIDDHRKVDERHEARPFRHDGKRTGRSSVTSFASTRVIFFEDDVDRFSSSKTKRKASYERRRDLTTGKLSKGIVKETTASPNLAPGKNRRGRFRVSVDNDRRRGERGDALPDGRSKSFDKRLFKRCKEEDYDEDHDFMNLLNSYEKRISDLDADFRLKLLQYVALCRSVKDLLMKRLPRPDDV